ncbi:unnamed protein product, partial [Staurois parvus]
ALYGSALQSHTKQWAYSGKHTVKQHTVNPLITSDGNPFLPRVITAVGQGRTDNSWGPWAIGDHGAPVSLSKLKKAYEKGTRGISWGPLLTPGPRAVPEFPNGQFAPDR